MPDYAPGTPMWVDFSSTDLEKANAFYTGLFGWDANVGGPEVGNYTIYNYNGKMAAGGGPVQSPEQPAVWSTYFKTEDAGATAEAVKQAGGSVIVEPFDVMDLGRMGVFVDPTGAVFAVWQPIKHQGAEHVNAIGGFSWSEYYTRDLEKGLDFYKQVFGFNIEETDMGGGTYHLFKIGDRAVAGGMDMAPLNLPAEVPPHWLVYFTVANTDETVEKAKSLGGNLLAGPMPTPMGPFAVLADPAGAPFAVIQINEQSSDG